jgi:ABC-type amino acid transport substrate-binding protein
LITKIFARRIVLAIGLMVVLIGAYFVFLHPRLLAEQAWQRIQSHGALRIGIDPGVARFSMYDAEGQWTGYEADVAREIARRLNLRVEPIPVGFDGFYDALLTDRVDVSLSALVPDTSRGDQFIYSQPTIDVGVRLIGRSDRPFSDMASLRDQRVGVVLGSEADRVARFYERRVPGMQRVEVANTGSALDGIRVGTFSWALVNGVDTLKTSCTPIKSCHVIASQTYAMAARREHVRLIEEINHTLDAMAHEGVLDQIAARHFS